MADVIIVEGVGGWMVPLNDRQDVSNLAEQLGLPIIIVVGIRLGCINQARLTFAAIDRSGLSCVGWIASCVEKDMHELDANIKTLEGFARMPLLAVFPYEEKINLSNFDKIANKTLQP